MNLVDPRLHTSAQQARPPRHPTQKRATHTGAGAEGAT